MLGNLLLFLQMSKSDCCRHRSRMKTHTSCFKSSLSPLIKQQMKNTLVPSCTICEHPELCLVISNILSRALMQLCQFSYIILIYSQVKMDAMSFNRLYPRNKSMVLFKPLEPLKSLFLQVTGCKQYLLNFRYLIELEKQFCSINPSSKVITIKVRKFQWSDLQLYHIIKKIYDLLRKSGWFAS